MADVQDRPAEEGVPELPVGRIVSVTGSQAILLLNNMVDPNTGLRRPSAELGSLLKIESPASTILGLVSALSVPVPSQRDDQPEIRIAELELVGEFVRSNGVDGMKFMRGISGYPSLGDKAYRAESDELRQAYLWNSQAAVRIGTLRQDRSIPAMVHVNELLGKHFAVLGSTGTGKSCAVALLLRAILTQNPEAHMLLLDPHNEYAASFGEAAEVITPRDLEIPFWFLTFEELIEVVIGNAHGWDTEIEILAELIPAAKSRYAANRGRDAAGIMYKKRLNEVGSYTVDTPVPYRISDLLDLIDTQMGRLENRRERAPFRQLKNWFESISSDPRYAFMFGSLTVEDRMADIIGRLFRVPVSGKPIAILELTGVPVNVVNVVVSVICRMAFDFALWSDGQVPITLVCEEAHRYVPDDSGAGFGPTRRAIARVAKEGRKYGVSLCVISQRPAELDPTILSQCSTIFAMRLTNERDQQIVEAAIFDTASSLLEFLPALATREAIVFGDGVTLPARVRFDDLPESALPRGGTTHFIEKWQHGSNEEQFLDAVIDRWRASGAPRVREDEYLEEPDTTTGDFVGSEEALDQALTVEMDRVGSGGPWAGRAWS